MTTPTIPRLSLIAALSQNRAIGKDNKIPWHIPEDLKRFRALTRGHVVVMGRRTFESIGRALPERINIVVTRDPAYTATGCIVVHSLTEALREAKQREKKEIFVIGGGEIYRQALPLADRLYLTLVEGQFEGDTFFPEYSDFNGVVSESEGKSNGLAYRFLDLER